MKRNFGLDVLRTVAILLVLANHAFLGFFLGEGHARWAGTTAFLSLVTHVSLDLLFVLSGFLIGTMMIRSFEAEPSFRRSARDFWLRRWFRTLPNYYLFLLVNIVLVAVGIGQGTYDVKHAFFVQNLAWAEPRPFFYNEAWSLAVDEWFYLAMPVLVGLFGLAVGRRGPRAFWAAALALIALPMLARALAPAPMDLWEFDDDYRRVTIYRLDATGWGVLAAIVNRWHPDLWSRSQGAKAALGAVVLGGGIFLYEDLFFTRWFEAAPRFANVLRLALPAAGTALALPWIASFRSKAPGWGRGFVDHVSATSYSIYLCHLPLFYVLHAAMTPAMKASLGLTWAQTALWLAGTFALAAGVHYAFEKPVSDLRERYTRRVDASPFGPAPPP